MRARNIKPSLCKNEVLGKADLINTYVYQSLWMLADREGRLEDRPERIHAEINPYRPESSTAQALDWLSAKHFIVRYRVNGQGYIWIPTFLDHQNPHMREPPSRIPPVEKADADQGSGNEHSASIVQASGEHQSSTGLAPGQHQSGPASSLIPPSLIPPSSPTERYVEFQETRPGPVERVFDHWKAAWNHPRAKLDPKRRRLIATALKDYSETDLRAAISGYLNSSHHCGENERRTVYDEVGLFLRDAAHIDAGLAFGQGRVNGPAKPDLRFYSADEHRAYQAAVAQGRSFPDQAAWEAYRDGQAKTH